MRPIRSLLFAPANRPDLLGKFPRYRADAFAIDLEDGTPEADKAAARRGRGTIDFEGGMVDEPLLRRAQAIVELAVDFGQADS